MYGVVQFEASEGGSISVIVKKWLTPMKTQVLWPPNVKESKSLDRFLKRCESPDAETWTPYDIQRVFYETNDLEKAKKKLLILESTSDVQTTEEENDANAVNKKRKRQRNKNFGSDSDSFDEDAGLCRPPPLKKSFLKVQDNNKENEDDVINSDDADIVEHTEHTTPVKWHAATIGNVKKTKLPGPLKSLGTKALTIEPKLPENPKTKIIQDNNKENEDDVINSDDADIVEHTEHTTPVKWHAATIGNVKKTKLPGPLKSLGTKALTIEPKLPENPKTKIILTDTIISLLSEIKVQNQKIIALLTNSAHTYYEPLHEDFKFPIQNEEEMITTETLLAEDSKRKQLVSYLKSLGGREVKDKVTRLMKFALADNLARQYNYYGKRSDKKPFSESRLRHCVIEAVKATTAKVTDREIEDTIKNWLKHAPQREKKRLSRNASQEEQQD